MSKSAFLTARIEPKLKQRASRVLAKVGVSTTDAITMFLRQVVLRGGLPFDVQIPSSSIGTANMEFAVRYRTLPSKKNLLRKIVGSNRTQIAAATQRGARRSKGPLDEVKWRTKAAS